MRVLVTGAAGFIGSHVARALLERGDTVVGLDSFNDFYDPAIKERNVAALLDHDAFTLVRGSLLDPAVRDQAHQGEPEAVVHLAAYAGVRPSIERPLLYQRENIEGTNLMLEAARHQATSPKFIFASSSSVYGENDKVPFEETDRVDHPISPYASTKKAGELIAHTYHHLFGLDVTCLRFFTVYGPGQRPDLAIHKFARLMREGQPIEQYGDGTSSRDYTYIDDIVQGVLAAIDRCRGYNIYNLGNNRTVTLADLIEKLSQAMGVTPTIVKKPMQPGDVPRTFASIERAAADLGYAPQFDFDEGLRRFVAWFDKTRP